MFHCNLLMLRSFKHPGLSLGGVVIVDQPDAGGEVLARLPSVTLVGVAAPLDPILDHALAHLQARGDK